MNNQKMFDTVVTHLRNQGVPAINDNFSCMYRSPSGLSCAIGCLIPDDVYHKGMEGLTIENLLDKYPQVKKYIADNELAMALQEVHDSRVASQWEAQLSEVADAFGLVYTAPGVK